jgi:exopolyphosphatase/guanosine-5'-triphosphate,3'-diphosphate pyrophosphatase
MTAPPAASAPLARTRQAVIDIGSNSVRLVIYDGPKRAPFPICNEKALCGLGRDMGKDGALNPAAVASALETLARFAQLVREHGDPPTRTIATAAVREAKDGSDFVAKAERLGLKIDVIDGKDEARLAALGVASFEPGASGLVGDMGGGSLELIALDRGQAREAESLSIGPLRLMQKTRGDLKAAAKEIDRALASVDWFGPSRFEVLFAVGGAWRSIARVSMQLRNHPLPVLHHYELTAKQAIETCDLVARQSRSSLETTPGISAKRVDALPYAALVLRAVLSAGKIGKVSISAGGVREGLLYRALTADERAYDPLLAGAAFLAERMAPEPEMGAAYDRFLDGAFRDERPGERRIRKATALLADVGAYFHPDLRGDHAFDTALRAPFYGVTHGERTAIALALYCRHEGAKAPADRRAVIALLDEAAHKRAMQVGLALRFAASIAPKAPRAVRRCVLRRGAKDLVFTAPRDIAALIDDSVKKRFDAFAEALDVPGAIAFAD